MFRCQSSLLGTGGNGEQFERARRICSANAFISSRRTQRLRSRQLLQQFSGSSRFSHAGATQTRSGASTDTSTGTDTSTDTGPGASTAAGLNIQQRRRLPRLADAVERCLVQFAEAGICPLFSPVPGLDRQ